MARVLVAVGLGFVPMVCMVVAVCGAMLMVMLVFVDMIVGVDVAVWMVVLCGAVSMGMVMFMAVLMIVIMGVLVFSLHGFLPGFVAAICLEMPRRGRALSLPFRFVSFLFTQSARVKNNNTHFNYMLPGRPPDRLSHPWLPL